MQIHQQKGEVSTDFLTQARPMDPYDGAGELNNGTDKGQTVIDNMAEL